MGSLKGSTMITTAKINWQGHVALITNYGCGRIGLENDARSFWQSRNTLAGQRVEPPDLVDLPELSHGIRSTWPHSDSANDPNL